LYYFRPQISQQGSAFSHQENCFECEKLGLNGYNAAAISLDLAHYCFIFILLEQATDEAHDDVEKAMSERLIWENNCCSGSSALHWGTVWTL